MSDNRTYYLRATIDFATWDERLAKRLIRDAKAPFGDERLGRILFDSIQDGKTEIDAVQSVENHGNSDLPGLVE